MGEEHTKAKGIAYHSVKKNMTIECLFKDFEGNVTPGDLIPYREMRSFKFYKHDVYMILAVKLSLNRHDDKRIVLYDQIHTLAQGHHKTK